MINIVITGNLGQDPELKYLSSGSAVVNFSVPVEKIRGSGENRTSTTTWVRVAAFGKTAEFVNQHFKKGSGIIVIADSIGVNAYTNKQGEAAAQIEVTASSVHFAPKGGQSANTGASNDDTGFNSLDDVGDIPF